MPQGGISSSSTKNIKVYRLRWSEDQKSNIKSQINTLPNRRRRKKSKCFPFSSYVSLCNLFAVLYDLEVKLSPILQWDLQRIEEESRPNIMGHEGGDRVEKVDIGMLGRCNDAGGLRCRR